MSNYSFMKSGQSTIVEKQTLSDKELENIENMLSLFTSNAFLNAAKYVECCERNGITNEDILYGLRYEIFEFLERSDIRENLAEIEEELKMEHSSEDELDMEEYIVPDEELNSFERIKKDKINEDNKKFVNKIHKYYDTWNSWEPKNPIEHILKNAIDKIN